jgi:hypothetical protein
MQKFLLAAILFFLILLTFGLFFFFYEANFLGSRASVAVTEFSAKDSYVFSNPRTAAADGKELIRVTVMILNGSGIGVLGRNVSLSTPPSVKQVTAQAATDSTGTATFDLSSVASGDYSIDVIVDGTILPQKAAVSFH